jgi:hypothetical protein
VSPFPTATDENRYDGVTPEDYLKPHTGLPVRGYGAQSQAAVDMVNVNKVLEEQVLRQLDMLAANPDIDPRWLAIGRTGIETAFMAVNRAIFQPQRIAP